MLRLGSAALIAAALLFYGWQAGSAINVLSPTVDELPHAATAWNLRFRADYRADLAQPPLWLHWVGLFLAADDLRMPLTDAAWEESDQGAMPATSYWEALKWERAGDIEALVRKARVPMFLAALATGAAIAAVGWRYAGPIGGAAAAVAFAFEPLMLGHGPLVKNDVVLAPCVLGAAVGLHEVCRTGRWRWVALLATSCGLAMNVKFSGLVLPVVVVPLGLALRALAPEEWRLGGLPLSDRGGRLVAAAVIAVVVGLTTWAAVWACYGFRFEPSRGAARFNIDGAVARVATNDLCARFARRHPNQTPVISRNQLAAWRPPPFVQVMLLAHRWRLLPEAAIAGMIYMQGSSLYRPAFLLGNFSDVGFPLYFPAAWLFKTPVTLVMLHVGGAAWACRRWRSFGLLFLPAGVYLAAALASSLNIGLRYLAPIYPFLMLAAGMLVAEACRRRHSRATVLVLAVLGAALAVEVAPHRLMHIQYFSAPFGGPRGGLGLLSDSNLDWGQDLYRLVEWQRAHPDEQIFLCYFGLTDPGAAGLRYENTAGSWLPGPRVSPRPGAVFAVSATHLQGTYFMNSESLRTQMAGWRAREPLDVLGGTIYLFRVPNN